MSRNPGLTREFSLSLSLSLSRRHLLQVGVAPFTFSLEAELQRIGTPEMAFGLPFGFLQTQPKRGIFKRNHHISAREPLRSMPFHKRLPPPSPQAVNFGGVTEQLGNGAVGKPQAANLRQKKAVKMPGQLKVENLQAKRPQLLEPS